MESDLVRRAESGSLVFPLSSIVDRLDLARLFPKPQPIEIELGSGDGTFLVNLAAQCPGHNFIGVERLLGRLHKLDRKGRRAGLKNLRAVRIESSYFLQYLLPARSVAAVHIYFPDPWPKRKHRRHRLVNEGFPALTHQALTPGGTVFLRTDDEDYFRQMNEVFGVSPSFRPIATPQELAALATDFEKVFQARGIDTFRAAYRAEGA
jgi:tRNA (guanine-N7-)-methyltransferase